ncbi:hypothetical protein PENTCL1PPCAC_25766, partial [Pristionchus entomophagus]
ITSNTRKRNAPASGSKPRTEEELKEDFKQQIASGNVRTATDEEIKAKKAQIKRRKEVATAALVVTSALALDAAAPPPPKQTATVQPSNTQPSANTQPPTTDQPPTTTVQPPPSSSKPDVSDSKNAKIFEILLDKFIKQSDSASAKIIKGAKQNSDSWIEENKTLQVLLQDSIRSTTDNTSTIVKDYKKNSDIIVEGYKKQTTILVEENQKLQSLIKETIAIQKANAADSKRIANQGNFTFGLKDKDGKKIVVNSGETLPLAFCQMIGKTLFKQFQIYLNGILVEDSSPLYAWRSIIETELNFDKETKNSTLSLAGYATDEELNKPTSSGHKRRSTWIQKDGEAQFAATLKLNLFNQPRLLLNYVDFKLIAYLNEPKFVIDSFEIDKDQRAPEAQIYAYEILDMKLLLHEYELHDSASLAIEQLLKQENIVTYPLTNVEMRSFYVPPGRFDTPECRLLTSTLPKRVVMCMLMLSRTLVPIPKLRSTLDTLTSRTLSSNVVEEPFLLVLLTWTLKEIDTPAYLNMLEGTGMGRSVGNNGITREMYKNGFSFFVFEISSSLDSETFDLINLGTTSFNIKFNKKTPEPGLYCILHCEYVSVLTIDDNRVPHVDALM